MIRRLTGQNLCLGCIDSVFEHFDPDGLLRMDRRPETDDSQRKDNGLHPPRHSRSLFSTIFQNVFLAQIFPPRNV